MAALHVSKRTPNCDMKPSNDYQNNLESVYTLITNNFSRSFHRQIAARFLITIHAAATKSQNYSFPSVFPELKSISNSIFSISLDPNKKFSMQ